jgi:hypothetical protein
MICVACRPVDLLAMSILVVFFAGHKEREAAMQ